MEFLNKNAMKELCKQFNLLYKVNINYIYLAIPGTFVYNGGIWNYKRLVATAQELA